MFAFFVTTRDRMFARAWQSADRGATAVEYSLIAGLVAAVVISVVATLGTHTLAMFTAVPDALEAVGAMPEP